MIEPVVYQRRAGGIQAALKTLEAALWSAWRDGCVGAVVGVDANGSMPHDAHGPDDPGDCRRCRLRRDLPLLPGGRHEGPLRIAIAVPVQSIEAWLLAFGHAVNRRPPGPPQKLDRREAKRRLFGHASPTPLEVRDVCAMLLPLMDRAALEQLAASQPSFRAFREEVMAFHPLRAGEQA